MVSADNISHTSEDISLRAPPDYLGENMNQHGRSPDMRSSLIGKSKTDKDVLPALDISDPPTVRKLFGSDMCSNVLEHHNSEVIELKFGENVGDRGIDPPATILEELFGSPLMLETGGFSTVAEVLMLILVLQLHKILENPLISSLNSLLKGLDNLSLKGGYYYSPKFPVKFC